MREKKKSRFKVNIILRSAIALLTIIVTLVPANSVLASASSNVVEESSQKILFVQQYTNNAWGYSDYGYFIDNKGNVRNFDLSGENQKYDYQDDDSFIAYLETLENSEIIGTVDLNQVKCNYRFLLKVNPKAKVTEKHVAFDFGQTTTYGIVYDEDGKASRILINSNGDVMKENTDIYAKKIARWLNILVSRGAVPELPTTF